MSINIKLCSLVITMVIVAIVISSNPFIFAQSLSNQTGNSTTSTKSNLTTNNSSIICSNSEEIQLGAAIQAFLSRDENKALMHMKEADKTITGAAKLYLDKSISAMQSGDTSAAKMHLGQSQYACGIPDVFDERKMIRLIIFI